MVWKGKKVEKSIYNCVLFDKNVIESIRWTEMVLMHCRFCLALYAYYIFMLYYIDPTLMR